MITFKAAMAIGFESAGKRDEITVYGIGTSKKAAKADAYRQGMTALGARCKPERYRVVYAVPTKYTVQEEPGEA